MLDDGQITDLRYPWHTIIPWLINLVNPMPTTCQVLITGVKAVVVLPVYSGFNGKLIVHESFKSLALVHNEDRSRCVVVYEVRRTAMAVWDAVRMVLYIV